MKIKCIVIFFFLIIICGRSYSQEINATGSPYSIFGLGDVMYYSSPRAYSMGIVGVSLYGNYINTLNPAALSKLDATTISIDANYGFLRSSTTSKATEVSNGNVLGFNIGIPIDRGNGCVMTLGFNPVTLINYKIRANGVAGDEGYTQSYAGKGGLSRIDAALSYTLFQMLSLGLEYNYGFGEVKNQNFIEFNNGNYTNTNIKNEFDFQKSFIKTGAVLEVGRLFKSFTLRNLTLGFVYQSGIDLDATQDGIYQTSLSQDTVNVNSGEINYPASLGFGFTNIFGNKYIVSGDFMMQNWSDYKVFGMSRSNFQESYRAGLGLEIIPEQNYTSFWNAMTYRFGGFYERAFYKVYDQNINTFGFRAGVNIPISRLSSVDIGLNYSIKGTTENGLIQDQFLNFTAGVNFGELWFLRPPEEDQ